MDALEQILGLSMLYPSCRWSVDHDLWPGSEAQVQEGRSEPLPPSQPASISHKPPAHPACPPLAPRPVLPSAAPPLAQPSWGSVRIARKSVVSGSLHSRRVREQNTETRKESCQSEAKHSSATVATHSPPKDALKALF